MSVSHRVVCRIPKELAQFEVYKVIKLSIYSFSRVVARARFEDSANDYVISLIEITEKQNIKLAKFNVMFDDDKELKFYTDIIDFIMKELDLSLQGAWQCIFTNAAVKHGDFMLPVKYKHMTLGSLKGLDG